MGEVTGGEQPPVFPAILDGQGTRAVRIYGRDDVAENPNEDVLLRADTLVAGLRVSNFIDDRQAVGRCYAMGVDKDDVPDAGTLDMLYLTPSDVVSTVWFDAAGVGDMRFQIYENTDPQTSPGTPITVSNVNRFFASTRPARTQAWQDPDFTTGSLGELIIDSALIGGEKKDAGLVANRNLGQLILLPGIPYLFRLLNAAGVAQDQSLGVSCVEARTVSVSTVQLDAMNQRIGELNP